MRPRARAVSMDSCVLSTYHDRPSRRTCAIDREGVPDVWRRTTGSGTAAQVHDAICQSTRGGGRQVVEVRAAGLCDQGAAFARYRQPPAASLTGSNPNVTCVSSSERAHSRCAVAMSRARSLGMTSVTGPRISPGPRGPKN
jgi:hypothetical protein